MFLRAAIGLVLVLLVSFVVGESGTTAREPEPNVIVILTDDLDARSISNMPKLRSLMIKRGTTFENSFVTNPICCPSRATLMRGQYSRNHGVLTNNPPQGGFQKFRKLGRQESTVVTWLDDAGYRTALFGKYLNRTPGKYKVPGLDTRADIASGGKIYPTDWYGARGATFIKNSARDGKPFYLHISTKAPHLPADPAPRHRKAFPNVEAPRIPSFNEEDVSDKPRWIRDKPPLSEKAIERIDKIHRKRLQSLLAVDEMIDNLIKDLRKAGELNNTYIFFTSDNGWAQGQHRRNAGKSSAYEEDIRVPLIVRGPGVPEGKTRPHMVLNNDLAPTFAELTGTKAPRFVDGRSFVPLLTNKPPSSERWRQRFLIEGYVTNKKTTKRPVYQAIRNDEYLWVEYKTGERELYDLRSDPYQLESLHETADRDLIANLSKRLDVLRDCAGASCRRAEGFKVKS